MNQPKRRGRPPKSSYVDMVALPPTLDGVMSWNEFVEYVRANGDWVVRASYPGKDGAVIDTIWRGVPLVEGEPRVMDEHSNWETVNR